MPDMHLLGQVRRGEVDHHTLLGARLVHRKLRIGQRGFEALGQGVAVLEEVEKARTGDLDLADLRVLGQCGDELLGQLPRLHAGRFGQHHGDVAGEVAVTLVLGVFHLDRGRQSLRQHALAGQADKGLLDQVANAVFHGRLGPQEVRENPALSGRDGCGFKPCGSRCRKVMVPTA